MSATFLSLDDDSNMIPVLKTIKFFARTELEGTSIAVEFYTNYKQFSPHT